MGRDGYSGSTGALHAAVGDESPGLQRVQCDFLSLRERWDRFTVTFAHWCRRTPSKRIGASALAIVVLQAGAQSSLANGWFGVILVVALAIVCDRLQRWGDVWSGWN